MHHYRLNSNIILLLIMLAGLMLSACQQTVQPTSITIKDSIRHYYPLIRGDELRMSYDITNIGEEPLVITDIQPSCSAIVLTSSGDDEDNKDKQGRVYKHERDLMPHHQGKTPWEYTERSIIVPPGKTEKLTFIYLSEMNLGYVSHDIRLYGNMQPEGIATITFDLHVVRPTMDHSDYEEIYFEHRSEMDDLIQVKQGEKGYWVKDTDWEI